MLRLESKTEINPFTFSFVRNSDKMDSEFLFFKHLIIKKLKFVNSEFIFFAFLSKT